ncbi:MAG: COX15/CtaA family protein [Pseudomonadota bacterium]
MNATASENSSRAIAIWLLVVCALIFIMVVLGGVTRLTRSGLSIVEWQPLMGAIPPLTETQWLALFEKYKLTPEYQKVNVGMDLAGFQGIFWLEYFHRLLGRLIGLAFALPFVYFLVRKKIERALAPKLWLLFALGAAQGLLGWLMVASGLVDVPRVSPYRLTAHLGLAILIYAATLWVALGLLTPKPQAADSPIGARRGPRARDGAVADSVAALRRFGLAVTGLVFFIILTGGFVAGTHAGFAFNDWPFMHGRLVPEGLFALDPWWVNLFENIATVQFNHRLVAYLLCLVIPAYWFVARRHRLAARTRSLFHLLLAMLGVQVTLGITTLLYVVPVSLAAAHQAGALLLLTFALLLNHALRAGESS